MKRKKLCICIPVYNRDNAIRMMLDTELDILKKYEIELIVCDSSNNNKTGQLTRKYQEKGAGHLFYKRFDSSITSNEKAFQIFQWAADSEYSFVWLIHDHTVCSEDAVRFLMQELDKGFDFYLLNMQAGNYGNEEFANINEFLLKGAWRLNSFGASVINTHTFLKNVDWDKMRQKYGGEKTLNYSHIGFYFERAAEIENLRACQLFFERKDFLDFYRTKEISWSSDTLRICLECWGEVITRLPEVYTDKLAVMRTQDKWFLSKYSLLVYRKEGRYSFPVFRKYRKWIKKIYPEDYMRDFWISVLPMKLLVGYYTGNLKRRIIQMKQAGGFVYIFGAGRHAAECGSFFDECRLLYDGFIVTSLKGNPNQLREHPVYEAENRLKGCKNLVVIAVLSSGCPEVENMLNSLRDSATFIDILLFAL